MSKQTSTEWLYEQLTSTWFDKKSGQHILEQAKAMEKERIEIAYNKGTVHGIDYPESTLPITGEQYYEQTYGGNK